MLALFISGQTASSGQGGQGTGPAPGQQKNYAEGEVLVKYREGVSEEHKALKRRGLGAQKLREIKRARLSRLKLSRGKSVEDAVLELMADPDVEYAEPNYIRRASWTPGDPGFVSQWGMTTIDAPGAWDIENSCAPVIAVIDSGVMTNHDDLISQFWVNAGETVCDDGIDDDGNGFVDDCDGWNFVADSNDVSDDWWASGHGTHVTGIIAASADNGAGVAGVCGGGAGIMTLKVLDSEGVGYVSDEIGAIYYALENGAKVINLSLGGMACSRAELEAIRDFGEAGGGGGLVVAAAGNSGRDNDTSSLPEYPASFDLPYIISVAASDTIDGRAVFSAIQSSNYGYWSVDLAAPGTSTLSTINNNGYDYKQGTSMAAPYVTGAVALINTVFPSMTNLEIKQQLLGSVDSLSGTAFGNQLYSGGRLNLHSALFNAVPATPGILNVTDPSDGTAVLDWTDSSTDETAFSVQRMSVDEDVFTEIDTTVADTQTYTDLSAPAEGAYYRVMAVNSTSGIVLRSGFSNIAGYNVSGTTIYTRGATCPSSGNAGCTGPCFIATAAYGTAFAPELDTLRHMRDSVLMKSHIGRSIINFYYRNSPPLAERISRHPALQSTCRGALSPVLMLVRHPLALIVLAALALLALSGTFRKKQED